MSQATSHRIFEPGTTGWTVGDLIDPDIQWQWSEGRHELVEGVLTKMTPQGVQGIKPLHRLRRLVERHTDIAQLGGEIWGEVDVLLRPDRVARPDLLYLTNQQLAEQERFEQSLGLAEDAYRPLYIMPYLIVESVSVGHEAHDRVTKRGWYAEAAIPNYWLLTAADHSLRCLKLEGNAYIEEAVGRDNETINTSAFGGLILPLAELWRKQ